ncbi:hypothetical protein ACFQ0O_09020 [Saccharopolyspora spinosporotrichia]
MTMARAASKADAAQKIAAGATMRVEPDQVDKLAQFFEDEAEKMTEREGDLNRLSMIKPPGKDPVSTRAVAEYEKVGAGDDSAYLDNYQKLAKVFRETAANLRASAQQTRLDDQNAEDSFRGGIRA